MPKPYSPDLRNRVIEKRSEGKTVTEIMSELSVKKTFVYDMLNLYESTGSVEPKAASGGRPPSLDESQLLQIEALVYETPDITLQEVKDALDLDVSLNTICNAKNHKLNLPRKKRYSLIQVKTEKM